MRKARRGATIFENPVLTGAVILLVIVIGVYVSYGADKGLPFLPTYQVNVRVPNAAKLVAGDEVRIGGARVGLVKKIDAVDANPPFAQLTLSLKKQQTLPVDTTVRVRPRSILGAKYVAITLGHAAQRIPDGGTLPLAQGQPVVEIDDAFKTFDSQTTRGIRGTINVLGDSFAGRGPDVNLMIGGISRLMPSLERFSRVLISPRTDLAGFIDGLAAFSSALQPVAGSLGGLLENGATTLAALDAARGPLGQAIDALPGTETAATGALQRTLPVLRDAAAIARDIRPGTKLLPSATSRLAVAVEAAIPALKRADDTATLLTGLARAGEVVASSPALPAAIKQFTDTLAEPGLFPRVTNEAQIVCNVGALWLRNLGSIASQGDANGAWITLLPILGTPQTGQSATPDPQLHANFYPRENATACESGNEPYRPGQQIGSPPGNVGTNVEITAPPPGVTALAKQAGLLDPTPGVAHP